MGKSKDRTSLTHDLEGEKDGLRSWGVNDNGALGRIIREDGM